MHSLLNIQRFFCYIKYSFPALSFFQLVHELPRKPPFHLKYANETRKVYRLSTPARNRISCQPSDKPISSTTTTKHL